MENIKSFENILSIKLGNKAVSLAPIIIIILLAVIVNLITKSKIGYHMNAVGEDMYLAEKAGINVDRTRKIAIILSTSLASLAQILFIKTWAF